MFILRLSGSVGTDSWGLWNGIISDCSTQIWDKKRLFGAKKKAQGTSDLLCFSHWNLPLVWLMMCLNQRSVGIARILMQIKPHLEGAGKALAELLKISCLKEGFFLLRIKEIFSEQGNFLSAWEKISLKSCCFCFLLITSINLAKVEWGDD